MNLKIGDRVIYKWDGNFSGNITDITTNVRYGVYYTVKWDKIDHTLQYKGRELILSKRESMSNYNLRNLKKLNK